MSRIQAMKATDNALTVSKAQAGPPRLCNSGKRYLITNRGYRIVYRLEPGQIVRLDYADIRDVAYDVVRVLRALREL